MKQGIFLILFLVLTAVSFSQDLTKFNLYKPGENAEKEIGQLVKEAKKAGKHVFIEVGGNWCVWCARFNDFITKDPSIDSLVEANYLVYHLNYSKENYNKGLLTRYRFPQRFGFPVFLVLDGEGELIHTQNSAYLEAGKSYDRAKVIEFFESWTSAALDPSQYKEQ